MGHQGLSGLLHVLCVSNAMKHKSVKAQSLHTRAIARVEIICIGKCQSCGLACNAHLAGGCL